MSQQGSKSPQADQNPKALGTFAATARNDGKRPKDQPRTRDRNCADPGRSEGKDEAARQVLKAGVDHAPERAQAAVKAVPDRTRPDR
jgi:hypothetical protein